MALVPQNPAGEVCVHWNVQKNEFMLGSDGSLPRSEHSVAMLFEPQSSRVWQNLPTPSSLPTSPG